MKTSKRQRSGAHGRSAKAGDMRKILAARWTEARDGIFTLGGYGMGRMGTKPRVLGAATGTDLVKEMEKYGVVFSRGEPGAGIVGASGLLLGLGRLYDMHAVCLMGETSGYFVDPKSAQAVLDVLTKYLGLEISFSELENKAKQIDQITSKLKDIEAAPETPDKREDLGYIG